MTKTEKFEQIKKALEEEGEAVLSFTRKGKDNNPENTHGIKISRLEDKVQIIFDSLVNPENSVRVEISYKRFLTLSFYRLCFIVHAVEELREYGYDIS